MLGHVSRGHFVELFLREKLNVTFPRGSLVRVQLNFVRLEVSLIFSPREFDLAGVLVPWTFCRIVSPGKVNRLIFPVGI